MNKKPKRMGPGNPTFRKERETWGTRFPWSGIETWATTRTAKGARPGRTRYRRIRMRTLALFLALIAFPAHSL